MSTRRPRRRDPGPEPAAPPAQGPPPALSPARRRLFTAVMLLLPVVFFVVLEGTLRLAGYGTHVPLFDRAEEAPGYRVQRADVGARYFARIADVPASMRDYFHEAKPEGALRLFVQGGSSAAGFPYYYGGAFSRILEERLRQTLPGREVEVVNTAMAAVGSFTLLDLADEILAEQPDAVLIYAGHNEYYGALGVGSTEQLGGGPGLVRAYLALMDFRAVQLLRDGLAWGAGLLAGRDAGEVPGRTLMERMVGEQAIPYGSPTYQAGLDQFRSNLARLLQKYERAGVPVFIGTLASNERDHAPFLNQLDPATDASAWRQRYRDALDRARAGDIGGALADLAELARRDTVAALPHYARGQLLERAGRADEARVAYLAAKDRDALRFRAPEAINEILREVAPARGATVVETRAALAGPDGIVGGDVMVEHLHPNVEGYVRLADAFYRALLRSDVLGPDVQPQHDPRAGLLQTPVDSIAGALRVRRLMASWPFQPFGTVDRALDTLTARDPVEALGLDFFRDRIGWGEAVHRLAQHALAVGDDSLLAHAARAYAQEKPYDAGGFYLRTGSLAMEARRYQVAAALLDRSIAFEETAGAHRMLGSIRLNAGDTPSAIRHLERSAAMEGGDAVTLYNLAGAYALAGRYDDARRTAERLLQVAPGHGPGRALLTSLPD